MDRLLLPKLEEGRSIFLQNVSNFFISHSIRVIIMITFLALVQKLLLVPKRNAVKIFAFGYDSQD